jgi:hypothetical protein
MSDNEKFVSAEMTINEAEFRQKQAQERTMKNMSQKLSEIDGIEDIFNSVVGKNIPSLFQEGVTSTYSGDGTSQSVNRKLKAGSLMTKSIDIPNTSRNMPQPSPQRGTTNQIFDPANQIVEEFSDRAASRVASDVMYGQNDPAGNYAQMTNTSQHSAVVYGDWKPVQMIIESGGKEKVRWSVNSSTGRLPDRFRHEVVAATVSAMLNETNGNTDDPRLTRVRELCNSEDSHIREYNITKKKLSQIPAGNVKKREVFETKIDALRMKIEAIRMKLGVR